jgi:hypothetical protein
MIRWLVCILIGALIGTGIVSLLCTAGCRMAGTSMITVKGGSPSITVNVSDTSQAAGKETMRGAKGSLDLTPVP